MVIRGKIRFQIEQSGKQAAKFVRKNSCVCCHNCLYCYTVVAMMSMLY